jgi:hypothetical protein
MRYLTVPGVGLGVLFGFMLGAGKTAVRIKLNSLCSVAVGVKFN